MKLNKYEVGMASDVQTILAPTPMSAAMYYALCCVNTNNPFLAIVFTENGEKYTGKSEWLNWTPDEEFAKKILDQCKDDFNHCSVLKSE